VFFEKIVHKHAVLGVHYRVYPVWKPYRNDSSQGAHTIYPIWKAIRYSVNVALDSLTTSFYLFNQIGIEPWAHDQVASKLGGLMNLDRELIEMNFVIDKHIFIKLQL